MAGTLPGHYVENEFSGIGTIDAVNLDKGTIVIGDIFFLLHEDVIVHSLRQQSAAKHKLKLGTKAAYSLAAGSGRQRLITEIWLLPKGYTGKNRRRSQDDD